MSDSMLKIKSTAVNFGPQHPSAHGVLRMVLELDGELVKRVDPHIGQLHRGTEKLMEYKNYTQSIPYMDRLDYVTPISYEHGWCIAIEKLLDIDIPIRAKYIRVLLLELSRITSHLFCMGSQAMDCGAMTPLVWGFELREQIMTFFEKITGARLHHNYIRVGGVYLDLPEGILEELSSWLVQFKHDYADILKLLVDNRIFKQRCVDIGKIYKDHAINFGFTGPNLRATGTKWDLRKSQPYEIYDELDFDVVVGTHGDSYDRFMVRALEVYESVKIIQQCIDNMPLGAIKIDNYKISAPLRADMKESMESMIHHFKFFSEGFSVPKGQVYSAVEVPGGEFGVYLVSQGLNKPYRVKLRAAGMPHLQALSYIGLDYQLADISAILGSLNVVFGEIDR